MHRLTGQDASYLYGETRTQYAHTLKLAILDQPEGGSFEKRRRFFEAALHAVPMLRWRILPTPLGLHHPLAVEDPDFDLDDHLHRAALPSPGGAKELASFISEVVSRPLDRSRPLWEAWLVEGLEGGRWASVLKMHHTLADGTTTARLVGGVATLHANEPLAPEKEAWQPEAIPSRRKLLWLAIRSLPAHLGEIWPRFVRHAKAARRRLASQDRGMRATGMYEGPHTSFNEMLSGARRYAFTSLPLAELKAVKSAHGVTFNDVFLAIVSGALRSYLEERKELPDAPLTTACPVNTRVAGEPEVLNSVSHFCVKLATEVDDPLERLASIHADTVLGKAYFEATRGAHLLDFMDLLPPPLRVLVSRLPVVQKRLGKASASNVVTSNVAGPAQPLFLGDSRLHAFYSVGPISEGTGINFTAYSYGDQFNVSVLADSRMVPDAWRIAELLQPSLEELRTATLRNPS